MDVCFDGLRKRLAYSYNDLVKELNQHIQDDNESFGDNINNGCPFVVDDIKQHLNDLCQHIGTILSLMDEDKKITWIDIDLEWLAPEKDDDD